MTAVQIKHCNIINMLSFHVVMLTRFYKAVTRFPDCPVIVTTDLAEQTAAHVRKDMKEHHNCQRV